MQHASPRFTIQPSQEYRPLAPMHCYRHAPSEALGICRSRGDALIANGEASFGQVRRGSVVVVIFPLLLGALLFCFGLGERRWFNKLTAMGAILAVSGVAIWLRNRHLARQLKQPRRRMRGPTTSTTAGMTASRRNRWPAVSRASASSIRSI
ncbi:hypothetical protein [Lysobacter capsici]|uniref:hypothetical protein n=1 Tax=Lysobacter capsici TaxID=435897 RepID=UPI00128B103B|nr:hypothetical protein [Lysobacter capsici]